MNIEKTFYGFSIKNIWNGEIKVYRLFSQGREYSMTFMGEPICKISLKGPGRGINTMKILYSRNANIPENEIIEVGLKVIEAAQILN